MADTTGKPEGTQKGKGRKPPPEHTRWPKGKSGNPGGSSRAQKFSATLTKLLNDPAFAEVVRDQILAGNTALILDHRNRVEGKVPDKIESSNVIEVHVTRDDPDA
jgi:hypothetical protein